MLCLSYTNCLTFQKENLNLTTVLSQIDACICELKNIKDTHTGTKYMAFLEKIPKHANSDGHRVSNSDAIEKQKLHLTSLWSLLLGNIQERLGSMGLIGIFTFMLPSNIPEVSSRNFGVYGDDEITKVCAHFKDHANLGTSVRAEWKLFKRILSVRCRVRGIPNREMTLKERNFYLIMKCQLCILLWCPCLNICFRCLCLLLTVKEALVLWI